jgi:hypothetical protein
MRPGKRYWMIQWTIPRGQPILELGVLFAFDLRPMQCNNQTYPAKS